MFQLITTGIVALALLFCSTVSDETVVLRRLGRLSKVNTKSQLFKHSSFLKALCSNEEFTIRPGKGML